MRLKSHIWIGRGYAKVILKLIREIETQSLFYLMYLCDLPLEFTWVMGAIEIAYSKQLVNAIGIADFVITMINSSCCGNGCIYVEIMVRDTESTEWE